jgi:outer membrane protein
LKQFIQIAALFFAFCIPSFAANVQMNVATINTHAVFQQLYQTQSVGQKLKAEFEPAVRELKRLEDEMKSIYEKRERDKVLLSEAEITDLNRQLEALQSEYKRKGKNFEDDKRKRSNEEQQILMVQVQSAITELAKANHYDLVLPIDATAFAKPELDISKQVLDTISKSK